MDAQRRNQRESAGRDLLFSNLRRGVADSGGHGPYVVGRGRFTATGSVQARIINALKANRWFPI